MMRELIGFVFNSGIMACPVCRAPRLFHEIFGFGMCKGTRWAIMFPHRAPCGRWCSAGGMFGDDVQDVHDERCGCLKEADGERRVDRAE